MLHVSQLQSCILSASNFQSILTHGSQYRVESILVRLAHTQNYLMLSLSREQVCGLAQR